jgi:hypothetical protein
MRGSWREVVREAVRAVMVFGGWKGEDRDKEE